MLQASLDRPNRFRWGNVRLRAKEKLADVEGLETMAEDANAVEFDGLFERGEPGISIEARLIPEDGQGPVKTISRLTVGGGVEWAWG